MQSEYSYVLREPVGKNFHPDFLPDLTPKQMLKLGVFGGKYMTDCRKEFPGDWFENAKLSPEKHDPKLKRWKAMKRHIAQIKKNCLNGDLGCRRKQRQALLHWGYDSRKF